MLAHSGGGSTSGSTSGKKARNVNTDNDEIHSFKEVVQQFQLILTAAGSTLTDKSFLLHFKIEVW